MADLPPDREPDSLPVDPASLRATPRWVKGFGLAIVGLILVAAGVAVSGFGGEHGPSRHLPGSPASSPTGGGHAPPPGGHPRPSG